MRLYYSISNGGDGSASPTFFETEMLSDMHQSFEDEWGEPCTGFLDIEGDNIVIKDMITVEEYLKELKNDLIDEIKYGGGNEDEEDYEDDDDDDDDDSDEEDEDDNNEEIGDIRDDSKITLLKRYINILTKQLNK